jgi:hypothetical protein
MEVDGGADGLRTPRPGSLSAVADLDGVWSVRRCSGALPPLLGVRKRIRGDRGETVLPGGLGVRFVVSPADDRRRELRYRPPFAMVVDVLEPDGDGWHGRTLVFGRAVGEFRMSPAT